MKKYWKKIEWYKWKYLVNKYGDIFNTVLQTYIKITTHKHTGYKVVRLSGKQYKHHRIIAQEFIPNPENKPQVNHINWIKTDNRIENLEWVTQSENELHKFRILWAKNHFKYNNPNKWKFWINNIRSKGVYQYNLSWEFIKEWNCIWDVTRELWLTHISEVCRWKRNHNWGFIWRYS